MAEARGTGLKGPVTAAIVAAAKELASERPTLFTTKGPGAGDRDTAAYMTELRRRLRDRLTHDYAEQTICGESKLCVDYYVPSEATVIEVALSLRNPQSEFERDILKALMAKDAGYAVDFLLFVSKPGAIKRHSQPSSKSLLNWLARAHGISVEVVELAPPSASERAHL